jgi:citrate synthase
MDDPDNPSLTALSDSYKRMSSVSAALSLALDKHIDPLHHGAGELVMKMVREIQEPSRTLEVLEERIENGERIYGLGHRIYKTVDPRAAYLSQMLARLSIGTEHEWINEVIDTIREVGPQIIKEQKGITVHPNVDLYNAAVYHALGLPEEMNTHLFAMARAAGWMAHILELERH